MALNDRTPAGANGEGSGKSVCLGADTFQISPRTREIQIHRLRSRYGCSASMARTVADLAFATPETWRSAR